MKFTCKLFSIVLLSILLGFNLYGQGETDTIALDLDLLKAPLSPAATMLGIADSEISRPSDPTAFMASLRQGGKDVIGGPTKYAIDFSPAWLFGAGKIKAENFLSDKSKYSIPQSLVVSFAINNENVTDNTGVSVPNTALAAGIKFSILRGKVSDNTQSSIDKSLACLQRFNNVFVNLLESEKENSPEWQTIQEQLNDTTLTDDAFIALKTQENEIQSQLITNVNNKVDIVAASIKDTLADISGNIDFSRTGFKLDFNSAIAYDFPNQNYGEGAVSDLGLWLTAAIEDKKGWSVLGIARYLYSPDQLFADPSGQVSTNDNQTFDAGVRLIFSRNKFSFSGEVVNRSVLNNDDIDSTIKYAFNTEYAVSANTKLTFSFGKAFDGTVTEQGNVIAALNFLKGFGSNRTVSNQK